MAQMRPPGVYQAPTEQRYTPINLTPSGVVGFVGLTEKGPTNEAVKLTEAKQFREQFGRLPFETYLESSVLGFFENGGTECYVLRVCHLSDTGRGEVAKAAQYQLQDANRKPSILVQAKNEGSWGNGVSVQVERPEARIQTLLTLDMHDGDLAATIRSTHGFRRGTVVHIHDDDHSEYRTITEVHGRDKTIHWRIDMPMERKFESGAPTYLEPVEFSLVISTLHDREVFRELSMAPNSDNYFVRVVNAQSRLVQLTDLRNDSSIADRYPVSTEDGQLSGGTDGLYNVVPDDFIGLNVGPRERFGLAAYEANTAIDLLVIPDLYWCLENSSGFRTMKDVQVVQMAMIQQSELLRDRFAILDFPNYTQWIQAMQWRLMFDSAYAAFYFPWVQIEVNGKSKLVPPSGHVAGIYSRCDQSMGVHRAPANEALEGVVDLSVLLNDKDIGELNAQGINCIRSFAKRGLRVWGARTISSEPLNRYINVRRTILAIIRAMRQNLQWVVFEPNDPRLWKSISHAVGHFLLNLWKAGYFKGHSPEEAFYVKCDSETNSPEVRDAGQVVVEVGVAPVRPAEFIVFRLAEESAQVGPIAS